MSAARGTGHANGGSGAWTLDALESEDAGMRACLELARTAAATDLPILILGESGTGKTLLARAIHNSSPRRRRAFVAFNAAALSDSLLDSQLFGHERGAFTGAQQRVKGKFEMADGGTLFIDEVADMSPAAQAKILRVVEYGEFERLGSEALETTDVRLISATHYPLARFHETGTFRSDLFYRVSGITLSLPPLRERPRDLPRLLASQIAAASRKDGKSIKGLTQDAARRALAYHWPGNLRELSRVVQAAVALAPGDVIPAEALHLESHTGAAATPRPTVPREDADWTLDTVERRHIASVLERTAGNKRRAARLLGVSRSTLDRKLQGEGPINSKKLAPKPAEPIAD